jgi:hypothetical protein
MVCIDADIFKFKSVRCQEYHIVGTSSVFTASGRFEFKLSLGQLEKSTVRVQL